MNALEHRYRLLIALLPAEHRTERGEELLGILLDLDDGRTRPSIRQASGVLGLALRLRLSRLAGTASLLLAAYLVAVGTAVTGQLLDLYTGAARAVDLPHLSYGWVSVWAQAAAWLGVAGAWILGARRGALAGYTALLAYQVLSGVLPTVALAVPELLFQLPVAAVMLVAWRRGWPATRPRGPLLACLPLAILLWKLIGVWGRHGVTYLVLDPRVTLVTAAVGGLVAGLLAARRRRPGAILLWTATGLLIGWLAPAVLLRVLYGTDGWLLSITAVIAAIAGTARLIGRRHAALG